MAKTTVLGLVKPTHGINEVEGQDPSGESNEAKNLDKIDAAIAALQISGPAASVILGPSGDQTITGGFKVINTGGFSGPLFGDIAETVPAIIAASGAIAQKQGAIRLGSSGALAMTLADPTSGTDDGKRLTIFVATAHAHVVTVTGGLAGGTNNTITFGGAVGDMAELEAIAGKWFLRPSINAVASHV
jgi:hypothetical protein